MTAQRTKDGYLGTTALETATGWPYGLLPGEPLPSTKLTPRQALDNAIRPALVNGPCHVTFSGGRDSSAVLAAATALARREGHPLPIPVTRRYPNLPETDETQWQQAVVEHLGLTEWMRFDFTDETELLGEAAQTSLRQRGVLWPPALHSHSALFGRLEGGSILTGEGGDGVLGPRRSAPLTVLRNRRRPHPWLLKRVGAELLPLSLRKARKAKQLKAAGLGSWLTPAAWEEHVAALLDDEEREPLRYDDATWYLLRKRSWELMLVNHAKYTAEFGLQTIEPLLDEGFVAALARAGGRWGHASRTATMRALFSDVLPEAVLKRSSKARFNFAYTGEHVREFARRWDGSGVDPHYVDVEGLRQVWLSEQPTMATGLLLHSAWLASQGD